MNTSRIFAAIEIDDQVRQAAGSRLSDLREQDIQSVVRWERPEKMHITLKFLAEATSADRSVLEASMAETAKQFPRFRAQIDGAGAFPDEKRPRVLWFGIGDGEDIIRAIATGIEGRCQRQGLPAEMRRYHPHLTAGRIRDARRARPITHQFLETGFEAVPFDVDRLVLIESKLQPGGSVYSVLSSFDLASAGA